MNKNDAKRALENYIYDYQYYLEKSKVREKTKDRVYQSIQRVKHLEEYASCDMSELQANIQTLIDIETKEEKMLIEILRKKQQIDSIIEKLDSIDRTIIYMRYTQTYTFEQIADKLNYSVKRIYQLHAIALDNFAVLYMKEMRKIGEN